MALIQIGIYKITNLITLEIYIGSSAGKYGIQKRWNEHRNKLRKNKHVNTKLQNSWNKYKENNFIFEIVELCPKEDTINREQYYIDTLNPQFNINKCAKSRLGIKHKQQAKDKLSAFFKGRPFSEEHKQKISNALKGKSKGPMSDGRKAKVSKIVIATNLKEDNTIFFKSGIVCR